MGSGGGNELTTDHPRPWVVKVLRSQGARSGEPCGAGLLVAPRVIVTCTHVAREAVTVPSGPLDAAGPVIVEVQMQVGRRTQLPAAVSFVHPDSALDLTVLSLATDANPLPIVWCEPAVAHAAHVFGYPGGYRSGNWSRHNEIAGAVDDGLWLIEASVRTNQRLAAGYSGAPVWDVDAQAVVGLVMQADASIPPSGTAYFLPTATIRDVCRSYTERASRPPPAAAESRSVIALAGTGRTATSGVATLTVTQSHATARRMAAPLKVFISSTYLDNLERRKLVENAVIQAGMVPVGMERFPASALPSLDECTRLARESDVYVGILAHRYGWLPPGHDVSITELEYSAALESNRPRFVFVLDELVEVVPSRDYDAGSDRWDKQKKLEAFKNRCAGDQMSGRFTEHTLQAQVLQALRDHRDVFENDPHNLTTAPEVHALPICPAPELPAQYVMRSELDELERELLAEQTSAVGLVGSQPVGVQGMGGVGKTVIASALAHSEKVRAAFADGVYWLTLGQTPDLQELQLQLLGALGIDANQLAADSPEKQLRVRQQALFKELQRRRCLLVLDDVWDAGHVEAAFGGGHDRGPSRRLFTSRRRDMLQQLGARVREIGRLNEPSALTLLTAHADVDLAQAPPELSVQARAIVKQCGGVALAIAMVGSMLRGKAWDRWSNLLDKLQRADLRTIEARFPGSPHKTLFASLDLSVAELPEPLRERYVELAVFSEDEPIPEAVLQTFWGAANMSAYDVQDAVDQLVDRALLRQDDAGRVVLHDLQHDYVRVCAGDRLAELHGQLVNAYAARAAEGLHAVGDDGYVFGHLAGHLKAAGRLPQLRSLLFDVRWLQAQLKATNVDKVVTDFELLGLDNDTPARLLRDTINLSSHVLRRRPEELLAQLFGRLQGVSQTELARIAEAARDHWTGSRLVPRTGCLSAPGTGLLRSFEGHEGSVTSVALSADGTRALSGSDDNTLKLWDTRSGELLRSLEGHEGSVISVALSADGTRALSGSDDTTLKLWDTRSGELLRSLEGHEGSVISVALSADGTRALSGSDDHTLKLWDTRSGELLRSFEGHEGWVRSVALSADGTRALSGADDTTLKLWDTCSGELLRSFEGHEGWVRSVALSADGTRALSGSDNTTLKLWDTRSGELLRSFEGHEGSVISVGLSADGTRALSGSDDKTLKLWDTRCGELLRSFEGHESWVTSVALSADGTRALSGSDDKTLKLWDTRCGELLRSFEGHEGTVYSVALSADGTRALSGSDDKTLKLWDTRCGELLRSFEGHEGWVTSVALSADGTRALSGSSDNTLKLWDTRSGERVRSFEGHEGMVYSVALSADGTRALSGSSDKTLKLWDTRSGELLRSFEGHEGSVTSVALSADGTRALSGSSDNTLKLWDTRSGELLRSFEGHEGWVRSVALSADGTRALSGADDNTLKLWDTRCGELVRSFEGHEGMVYSVALSADGTRALSGSDDKTLKLWDAQARLGQQAILASFTLESRVAIATRGDIAFAGDWLGRVTVFTVVLDHVE